MVSVSLGATIPVAQYANLQPVITMEGETVEAAMAAALGEIKKLWDQTAKEPLDIDRGQPPTSAPAGRILQCRVSGAKVIFDPIAHTYHDLQGRRYMGGSTFAGKFKSEFHGALIAGKMAEKHGVDADKIQAMWALNAEASSSFGTGVHAALQLYGEYLELSKTIKGSDESALTKNPTLRPMVEKFFTPERSAIQSYYEEFVADEKSLRCGLIDRLEVEPDGLRITDFKTNTSLDGKEKILPPFDKAVPHTNLGVYWLQLSHYASVLQAHGRIVKGLRVYHWTGSDWDEYDHDVVDLSPAFEEKK